MSVLLTHASLRTTLRGVELLPDVAQFRGIPYGRIPRRFAEAESIKDMPDEVDCTRFGPRCPQLDVDVGTLLRIPRSHKLPNEPQSEFECTNLDVTLPKAHLGSRTPKLPVLVWIHGGSQAMTFGSAASGVCDMTTLVADSVRLQRPIIAVAVQYRLNVFAIGDGSGPANLALRDQALALQWVQSHISSFGGDPDMVTLAGESAGAVYCHAHLVLNSPARQYVLSSGSLHLSPPQPAANVSALRNAVAEKLRAVDPALNLHAATASQVVEAIGRCGIQSWFLQAEDGFDGWQTSTGGARRLLLSDVQRESVIWQAGVWSADEADILGAFDKAGPDSDELKRLYHIYPDRQSSCKIGALDFINDYKFVLPIELLAGLCNAAAKPAFRCMIDEPNPWQPSSGAHHAVDLVLLFGGFDLSSSHGAQQTGRNMREAWIKFLNLEEPWSSDRGSRYAFGPYGVCQALDDQEAGSRRRMVQVEYLKTVDRAVLDKVFFALAAGRISLLN
ncbi:hypothetical protein MKZ38_001624 [Zalerion maritima]|uniref:Carboxylic ester hydrolase n=1 Tax=Zalerion maritima TaxID=339359 RepID=A0AAD5RQ01_9PEZI|nr:hypothetical protein MKZ38_001624 [Zalerion maritima]